MSHIHGEPISICFFHWGEGKIKTYENLVVYDMGFYHVLPKKYIGLYRVFLLGEVSFIHIIHIWDRILL